MAIEKSEAHDKAMRGPRAISVVYTGVKSETCADAGIAGFARTFKRNVAEEIPDNDYARNLLKRSDFKLAKEAI